MREAMLVFLFIVLLAFVARQACAVACVVRHIQAGTFCSPLSQLLSSGKGKGSPHSFFLALLNGFMQVTGLGLN